MKSQDLKLARQRRGWTQKEAAARLALSQPYLSMLESGKRRVPPRLARTMVRLYRLPPTALPPSAASHRVAAADNQSLAEELARLGYPGFAYLRTRRRTKNPAEVLLAALAVDDLEARLVEALPWPLLRYEVDTSWLAQEARFHALQNRLGFVVNLARRVAESSPRYHHRAQSLRQLEQDLERSRLAVEDTLCRRSVPPRKRRWLEENRPAEAAHWHLLTDWRPESLRYVG